MEAMVAVKTNLFTPAFNASSHALNVPFTAELIASSE
jgi:hypothetical protein